MRFGFRHQKIAKTLDFGKVHPAIDESPARELSCFCQACSALRQNLSKTSNDHRRAMRLNFCDFLAGEAVAGLEPYDQGLIQGFSIHLDVAKIGLPRTRQGTNQFLDSRAGAIRVSPHLYNDEADIERLIEVLYPFRAV